MKTYPLESIGIEKAKEFQFKLIDSITKEFDGDEVLDLGDLGVVQPSNEPLKTRRVEKILADFFEAEDSVLLRGSGTGSIREALASTLDKEKKILIHTSPVYSTTKTTLDMLNYNIVTSDYNDKEDLKSALIENENLSCILIQHSRQTLEDSYNMEELITFIKNYSNSPIIVDDNYAVMKVEKIGSQLGADLSCFSMFKLLGPQGIGCVVGKRDLIEKIRSFHYSGGSQVQGFEAMDVLRSLVYAPVSFAIQAEETEKIVSKIEEIKDIDKAFIANSQSKVILVKFCKPIAEDILVESKKLGAASHPVGSESRYEFVPMFYRVSGTMREKYKDVNSYWIRINPMRSGCSTVIRILEEAIRRVKTCS